MRNLKKYLNSFKLWMLIRNISALVITLHPENQTSIYGTKVLANLSLWIFAVLLNHHNFVSEN